MNSSGPFARSMPACAYFPVRLLLAIICAVFTARSALAENPARQPASASAPATPSSTPTSDDIAHWIKDLSSDAYSLRQEAAARLLSAGMAARQSLRELADGSDPETRAAARRLIALIDRSEFRRRLDAFAADTDGRQGLSLPGWDEYQKLIGSDPPARALFVEMQRQEAPLFAAIFGTSKRGPEELWESRLIRIAQWQNPNGERGNAPPVGSCAAMLFLGSLPDMNVSDAAASFLQTIIQRPPVNMALATDNAQPALRKLAVSWLVNCPNKSEELLKQRLSIISQMNLSDALPLALKVCSNDPKYLTVTPLTKGLAMVVIGQFGNRSHVALIEPLLEDSTVCLTSAMQVPNQPAMSVQVRDVALVELLNLTDQAPADYGYTAARLTAPHMFQLPTLYRESDALRAESIAKWRQWRAEHKDDLKAAKKPAPADESPKK